MAQYTLVQKGVFPGQKLVSSFAEGQVGQIRNFGPQKITSCANQMDERCLSILNEVFGFLFVCDAG